MEAPTSEAELDHRAAPREAHQAASGPDRLLTRREASSFLREHAFPVAEATLATKATRGGGPPYSLFGRRALYRAGDLLGWAQAGMTAPRRSTAEADVVRER